MLLQAKRADLFDNYLSVLFDLFLTFMKISPLTFGGGIAIIPHIESEIVSKKKWFSKEDVPEVIAIAQSAPGSIAINSAIYIGYMVRGLGGALAAMAGMLVPSALIIFGLTYLFLTYQDLSFIQNAFKGIRPAIIGLILFASFKIGKSAVNDRFTLFLFIIAAVLLFCFHLSPVFLIIGGAITGWFYHAWVRKGS
ncbi:chromate transporter [Halobacillus karajensis]|uniref:Chromate transport protein n=1 Tax=Halobacillus karajensis TaxID=195088 RepID=A0A024P461_9BACI|nr:chromate transporter [Halobacillus karajensis]CDQ20696.1 Chromate transport protein [Halobacillus karajensis]CDQ23834.1 Chromate transport protein [Halobacillus karajensis]CDQ27312.1 Chromate transport protein [Halobacillus karajensis]SEH87282.1 chromate transporter [Halobacillus karajensis]